MTDEVDLLVGPGLDPAEVTDIRAELAEWGLAPRVRRMPTRRGAEIAWSILLTLPAEIVVKTMLEHLGVRIYQELQTFVQRRLRRAPGARPVVVIESPESGARYALDADLPLDAYHQMIKALTVGGADDTLRTFDRTRGCWTAAEA